jgi:hypothetical protein
VVDFPSIALLKQQCFWFRRHHHPLAERGTLGGRGFAADDHRGGGWGDLPEQRRLRGVRCPRTPRYSRARSVGPLRPARSSPSSPAYRIRVQSLGLAGLGCWLVSAVICPSFPLQYHGKSLHCRDDIDFRDLGRPHEPTVQKPKEPHGPTSSSVNAFLRFM